MNKICEIKFGSHLYGTNTEKSDMDFKGIYLPSPREIVLGNYRKSINQSRPKAACERNTKDDVDVEIFSLDRYLELLCDGQTVALDILFAPFDMYSYLNPEHAWIMAYIYNNREQFLNKNVNAFVGYARQQAAKYGIKGSRMDALKQTMDLLLGLPAQDRLGAYSAALEELVQLNKELVSLEKTPLISIEMIPGPDKKTPMPHLQVANRKVPYNATVKFAIEVYKRILDGYGQRAHKAHLSGGKDYKALSHAIRVNGEAKELLETGKITFPRPDREYLLKVKNEQVPFEEVAEVIERGLAELMEAQENSSLREEPNRQFAEDLVVKVYTDIVKKVY